MGIMRELLRVLLLVFLGLTLLPPVLGTFFIVFRVGVRLFLLVMVIRMAARLLGFTREDRWKRW